MAEENRTGNTGIEKPVQKGTDNGTGTDTSTTTKRKRTRPGTDAGTGTDTGAGKETGKEVIPQLANISGEEVPAPKKPKQKRTRTPGKKNNPTFNAEQITSFIVTMSGVLSTSEGGKFFALTKAEAEQLAVPLANIIAKNDSLSGLGEHSDTIALAGACALIFLPRLLGYLNYRKAKNKDKTPKLMIKKEQIPNGTQRENSGNNGQTHGATPMAYTGNGESILSGLPSLAQ